MRDLRPAIDCAAALARAQPKTFAAVDDPYRHERQVRAEQAEHRAQLDRRPADVAALRRAEETVAARQSDLEHAQARLAHWRSEHERTAGVRGLTPGRRRQHQQATQPVAAQAGAVERETHRLDNARADRRELEQRQTEGAAFDRANQWRHDRIRSLDRDLELYWAAAVLDAARDGYPVAYGKQGLRAARQTIMDQIGTAAGPPDAGQPRELSGQIEDPRRALADLDRSMQQAAARPAVPLVEAVTPRPPRSDRRPNIHHQNVADRQLHNEGPSVGIGL